MKKIKTAHNRKKVYPMPRTYTHSMNGQQIPAHTTHSTGKKKK